MQRAVGLPICLSLVVLLFLCHQAFAQEEVLFQLADARGDDTGAGDLLYPEHEVYVPGLFDLWGFQLSQDPESLYFDFHFATLTNPFRAPEGYFHQRLEVYIQTGEFLGPTELAVGTYRLQTAPDTGWNLRLSVAPFAENRLYVARENGQIHVFSEGIQSFRLPESNTLRVQVDSALLPQPNTAWGYYILVGAFDGLAQGFWRDVGDGPWQIGGTGTPIFDLLAPRWGKQSQKFQLSSGVLYPVRSSRLPLTWWLFAVVFILFCLGFAFLWRWWHGRS